MADRHYMVPGILTVGMLKQIVGDMTDDSTQVVMDDLNGWYCNIAQIIVPGELNADTNEFVAVTFVAGETFDSRQT